MPVTQWVLLQAVSWVVSQSVSSTHWTQAPLPSQRVPAFWVQVRSHDWKAAVFRLFCFRLDFRTFYGCRRWYKKSGPSHAEAVSWGDTKIFAHGLGAYIAENTASGDYPKIVLGIAVMSLIVILFNRLLWRPLYAYAEERLRLD